MKDHSELNKIIPRIHKAIHKSLSKAGMDQMHVHPITFGTTDDVVCKDGASKILKCQTDAGGTTTCINVCP